MESYPRSTGPGGPAWPWRSGEPDLSIPTSSQDTRSHPEGRCFRSRDEVSFKDEGLGIKASEFRVQGLGG